MVRKVKDPQADLDYTFNWLDEEVRGGPYLSSGETITVSTWSVPDDLDWHDDGSTTTTTWIWLSGGTAGHDYTVTNQITTSEDRIDERSFILSVREQ